MGRQKQETSKESSFEEKKKEIVEWIFRKRTPITRKSASEDVKTNWPFKFFSARHLQCNFSSKFPLDVIDSARMNSSNSIEPSCGMETERKWNIIDDVVDITGNKNTHVVLIKDAKDERCKFTWITLREELFVDFNETLEGGEWKERVNYVLLALGIFILRTCSVSKPFGQSLRKPLCLERDDEKRISFTMLKRRKGILTFSFKE